ncbi:MAG TPA: glycosyltransferase family 4 protein [Terracidiphilus sp.]|nr:glycosyltransferase family 4 protein [Terracidiphilus sp.]
MNTHALRRIAIVFPREWGFNRRLERLFAVAEQLDAEIHVICRNLSNKPRLEQVQPRVWVHRLPYLGGIRALSSHGMVLNPVWAWAVRDICARYAIDLVIVREFPLVLAVRGILPRRIPVVMDMAENLVAMALTEKPRGLANRLGRLVFAGPLGRWVERLSCFASDGILVVIEENRDRLVAMGVNPRKIHVFHSVPVPELMQPRPQTISPSNGTSYELRAAYLGDFDQVRGLPTVVDAAAELRDRQVRVQFVLMGAGLSKSELENRAKQRGVSNDMVMPGHVPFRDGLGFIQACDVGLVPHFRCEHTDTTIPNKLFDYMYMGKPVIVSDALPLARIVQTHECGLVFPSGDAGKLAEALAYLAANPKARQAMGENGRAAILKDYAWNNTREALGHFLSSAVENGAPSHA